MQALHNKQLNDGIEVLFERLTGSDLSSSDVVIFTQSSSEVISEKIAQKEITEQTGRKILNGACNTLIGKCKDPYNSPQPGEIKGRICKSLHSCIFCENCWIFVENLPDVLKYRNNLLAEKANLTDTDWEELHGDAVRAIETSILPSFPESVVKEAEAIACVP